MIWETFLPCIFFGNKKPLSPIVGALSTIPSEKSGSGLLDLVMSVKENFLISQWRSAELIQAVMGKEKFPTPTTSWRSSKKGVMGRKTRLKQTKTH